MKYLKKDKNKTLKVTDTASHKINKRKKVCFRKNFGGSNSLKNNSTNNIIRGKVLLKKKN